MTVNHHAMDETLLAYAGGGLPEGLSLAVAVHLTHCPQCRGEVRRMESCGGALMDGIEPLPLDGDAMSRVMSQLDDDASAPSAADAKPAAGGVPAPLRDYVAAGLHDLPWRPLVKGIQHYPLATSGTARGTTRLLRIAPGTFIPPHGHDGSELTVVLDGSFSDEIGRFQAGDLADLNGDVTHQPIADADGPCICLIATDAPLRFKGLVSRMLQPLVGI